MAGGWGGPAQAITELPFNLLQGIGAIAFGERLLLREAIGGLVIGLALVIVDGRLPRAIWTRLAGRNEGSA